MPTYVYRCVNEECNGLTPFEFEKNVPMNDRDSQFCTECFRPVRRKIAFTGLTWAPTSTGGGMR